MASTTASVTVKWQKQTFTDLAIDLSQPPFVFKTQLFSLTGVPPERQKIMGFKGGLLKDDADWTAVGARPGLKITMMGTADAVPEAPTATTTFMEDLPEEEQDKTGGLAKYGAGLENLGNTCYANSTVQCLYAVPELRNALAGFNPAAAGGTPSAAIASATRNLFAKLERSGQAVAPMEFLLSLRRAYPQFDQRTREGVHMQQDAEECWGALLLALRGCLTDGDATDAKTIQRLFGVRTVATLKCDETDETMDLDELELMMKCNISGEVNHLGEGLRLGLQGDREKTSAQLGRLAAFRGEAAVASLPPYLTVQMVRFFYKADVQQKAKILRKVTFPLVLDLFEFCTEELKAALEGPRLAYKEADDAKAGLITAAKKQKVDGGDAMEEDTAAADPAVSPHSGALTGRYELIGVLTHKGRSADSGHYVSWVKQEDGQWIQFDDDQMIPRKEEEVLALSGGGDWHMAYLLLYKGQRVPMPAGEEIKE